MGKLESNSLNTLAMLELRIAYQGYELAEKTEINRLAAFSFISELWRRGRDDSYAVEFAHSPLIMLDRIRGEHGHSDETECFECTERYHFIISEYHSDLEPNKWIADNRIGNPEQNRIDRIIEYKKAGLGIHDDVIARTTCYWIGYSLEHWGFSECDRWTKKRWREVLESAYLKLGNPGSEISIATATIKISDMLRMDLPGFEGNTIREQHTLELEDTVNSLIGYLERYGPKALRLHLADYANSYPNSPSDGYYPSIAWEQACYNTVDILTEINEREIAARSPWLLSSVRWKTMKMSNKFNDNRELGRRRFDKTAYMQYMQRFHNDSI